MTSLKKGIAFSPLWPLWPLWCLCVASVEIRHCVHSSMEFRFFSLRKVHSAFFPQRRHRGTTEATEATEEKMRCLFPERSQRRRFFFVDAFHASKWLRRWVYIDNWGFIRYMV